jgi:hypothetical protein
MKGAFLSPALADARISKVSPALIAPLCAASPVSLVTGWVLP